MKRNLQFFVILFLFTFCLSNIYAQAAGNCLDFNNTNSYVGISDDNSLDLTTTLTVEMWIWFDDLSDGGIGYDWQCLFAKNSYASSSYALMLRTDDSLPKLLRFYLGSTQTDYEWPDVSEDTWFHIAVTSDGSITRIYIDGEEKTSGTGEVLSANDEPLLLGLNAGSSYPLNGRLDEFRLWNAERTQAEIQNNMKINLSGNLLNLQAYWQFNENSGTTAYDLSSNNNHGTLNNFTLPDAWTESTAPIFSPSGNCLDFDGSDDYVEISDNPILDLTDTLTVELWVSFDDLTPGGTGYDWQCLLAKDSFDLNAYALMLNTATAPKTLRFYGGNTSLDYLWSDVTTDIWYHIAVTSDGDTAKIYINGQEQAVGASSIMTTNDQSLLLGQSGSGTYPLHGKLDDVRIWDTKRTQSQIQTNISNLLNGDETGLAAYYRFDQGDAGQNNTNLSHELIDYAGCNIGTLTNFALDGANSNWLATGMDRAPIIGTINVDNLTESSADVSGNIFSIGASDVTTRGVCYSTSDCPTISDNTVEETGTFGTGEFTINLSGLESVQFYYVRVYAINTEGVSYGETQSFRLAETFGNCLDFDGSDDYVEILGTPELDLTTEITAETWIKFDDLTVGGTGYDWQCLFAKSSYNSNAYALMLCTTTVPKTLRFYVGTSTLDYLWTDITTDIWYHIAVTSDGYTAKIYIDGIEKATGNSSLMTSNDEPLFWGRAATSAYPLHGKLDDARIWEEERTQAQIQTNMNSLLNGDEIGLVAYYRFDQGDAGQDNTGLPRELVDYAGCNKGALINFALNDSNSNWLNAKIEKIPIVGTTAINNITPTSADVSGNIFSIGSNDVTTRGVCYSTSTCPTISDNTVEETGTFSTGTFTMNLTGLTPDQLCYARAYAVNNEGLSYGETQKIRAPNIQAYNIIFTNVEINQMDIAWSNGNGESRAVFMLEGSKGNARPAENTSYTPSSVFGLGDQIGTTGWYCVYNGANSNVTVTGLSPSFVYRVMVCEYNQISGSATYNINTAADNPKNQSTVSQFTDINAGLTGVLMSSAAWGDYDNDGDLDILLTGGHYDGSWLYLSKVYRNDGNNIFSDSNAGLTDVLKSSVAWGDYDNDGNLDILLTGESNSGKISKIYRNNEGTFVDVNAGLTGVSIGDAAWGDYDNDGDLDILMTGSTGSTKISKVYRNDEGTFVDINAGLTDVSYSSVAWGDYDNDGDLDILLTGANESDVISKVYRNDGGTFTDINAGLVGVFKGSTAWGDYDNDGDLDILLTGGTEGWLVYDLISKVYRNDGGTFTDINAGLMGVFKGSTAWGDYDNDGDLDILLTGKNLYYKVSKVYRNDEGTFVDINAGLTDVYESSVAWGDYDNDGDLDILLTGADSNEFSKIYRNNSNYGNTPPTAPTGLNLSLSGSDFSLSWNPAMDNQTPVSGLTYNLRVGSISEGIDIVSPMAFVQPDNNGKRKIVAIGSQNHNTNWVLTNMGAGRFQISFHWSVQAIDTGFMGSTFATEDTFESQYPQLANEVELLPEGNLFWETQQEFWDVISGYQIQIDDDSSFTSLEVDNIVSLDLDNTFFTKDHNLTEAKNGRTAFSIFRSENSENSRDIVIFAGTPLNELTDYANLTDNTVYYWRMKPIYNDGVSSVFTIEEKTFFFNKVNSAPNAPTSGFTPANDEPVASLTPLISWNNATDPDLSDDSDHLRYFVEVDSTNLFNDPVFADTTAWGVTSIQIDSGLMPGFRYYYRIKTQDDDLALSNWSATQQFLTLMPPQNVTVTPEVTGVTISWDEMPFNNRGIIYTVYSSDDPYAEFPDNWTVEAVNLSTTSWFDGNALQPAKFYRITAGNEIRNRSLESMEYK